MLSQSTAGNKGRMEGWTDGCMDRWTNGRSLRTDGWNGLPDVYEWMKGRDERVLGKMDRSINGKMDR